MELGNFIDWVMSTVDSFLNIDCYPNFTEFSVTFKGAFLFILVSSILIMVVRGVSSFIS